MLSIFRAHIGIVAVFATGLTAQTQDWQQIELHYKQAQEALRQGKSDVAKREFQEILRLQPSNAQAHANIGVIAFTGQNYAESANEFRAALKLQPTLWNATALLGMSERHLGHPAKLRNCSFLHFPT